MEIFLLLLIVTGNVSITRCVLPLVARPVLDFVMIQLEFFLNGTEIH